MQGFHTKSRQLRLRRQNRCISSGLSNLNQKSRASKTRSLIELTKCRTLMVWQSQNWTSQGHKTLDIYWPWNPLANEVSWKTRNLMKSHISALFKPPAGSIVIDWPKEFVFDAVKSMDPPNRLHCTKAKNIWNAQLAAKVQANQRCQPGFLTPPSWHMIVGTYPGSGSQG